MILFVSDSLEHRGVVYTWEGVVRKTHGLHVGSITDCVSESFHVGAQPVHITDVKDIVFVKPQVALLHVVQLIENNDRGNNQKDRNRKLKYDQRAPHSVAFNTSADFSLQHFYRIKGGEVKGRIAACHDPNKKHHRNNFKDKPEIKQGVNSQFLSGEGIE